MCSSFLKETVTYFNRKCIVNLTFTQKCYALYCYMGFLCHGITTLHWCNTYLHACKFGTVNDSITMSPCTFEQNATRPCCAIVQISEFQQLLYWFPMTILRTEVTLTCVTNESVVRCRPRCVDLQLRRLRPGRSPGRQGAHGETTNHH